MNEKIPFIERMITHFNDNEPELDKHFNKQEKQRLLRLRDLYNEILRNPMRPDAENVKWLERTYFIKKRQAQYDLSDLRSVKGLGNLNKDWLRFESIQGIRKMLVAAEEAGDYRGYAALMKNLDSIARLSKNEPEPIDMTKIYPMPIEPTTDVSVLGLTPYDEETKARVRAKYGKFNKKQFEEIEYEEIKAEKADPFIPTPVNTNP